MSDAEVRAALRRAERALPRTNYAPNTVWWQLPRLASDLLRTREALRVLLAKLDKVGEATRGIYVLASVHGMGYGGPTYEAEKAAARACLPEFASREST